MTFYFNIGFDLYIKPSITYWLNHTFNFVALILINIIGTNYYNFPKKMN